MPPIDYNSIFQPIAQQYQSGAISEGAGARQIGQLANQYGIGTKELSGYVGFSPEQINQSLSDYNVSLNANPTAPGPPSGLSGASSAIGQGFNKATQGLDPFMQQGQQANEWQAAISGAMGPEAQAEAYKNFQASPGQKWLQEQGEIDLTRTAAATGGLGGGNLQKDLSAYRMGLGAQDLQNQFGRVGDVATRGLSAGTTIGGLRGQEAGLQGQYAYQAGRDISQNIRGTTSALADLMQQQGAGGSDIIGAGTNNVQALINAAAQGDAGAKEQLATTLANLGVQGSSQYSAQPNAQFQPTNTLGQIGQIASGLSGLYSNLPQGGQPYQPSGTTNWNEFMSVYGS